MTESDEWYRTEHLGIHICDWKEVVGIVSR